MLGPQDIVVVTGAEGKVGAAFREEYLRRYRNAYRLRLAVRNREFRDSRFDQSVVFDLLDRQAVEHALTNATAVLHLAAEADEEATFDQLLGPNLVGTYNLFDEARKTGCKRIVFASSVHAVLGRPAGYQPHAREASMPDCLYGATKVFGEALCSAYASEHGISCIAVRIGSFVPPGEMTTWLDDYSDYLPMGVTQRDLCQLLHLSLTASPQVRFALLQCTSNNRYRAMEIETSREQVGYEPQDDMFDLADREAHRERG